MAHLARSYYVLSSNRAPEWKKQISRARLRADPPIEVPLFPITIAAAYHVSNGEHIWVPRLLSSLFWITGSLFLYFLATRFVRPWAASVAVAVYLFLPFAIVASTSFQPDPLMVALLLAAILAIVRHHEKPTRANLNAAIAVSAAALFLKPGVSAFFLLPLFGALALVRDGLRDALRRPVSYVFPTLTLLPAVGFYVYSAITEQFVTGRLGWSINPRLLDESFYWRDWLDMIEEVLRPPFFGDRAALCILAVAASGVLLARTRTQRAILLALWSGYAVFGLVITNYVSTHSYYSLPLVPIVALSLAVVAGTLGDRLQVLFRRRSVQATAAALLAAVAAVGVYAKAGDLRLPNPDRQYEQRIAVYERIGDLVHHTSRALVLGGTGFWHYAWVAGAYWPDKGDLEWEQKYNGLRRMDADERFRTSDERYYPAVGTIRPRPSIFIVVEPIQLALEPDLSVLLSDFRLLAEGPDYEIFDLTRRTSRNQSKLASKKPAPLASSSAPSYYRFPPTWIAIDRGQTRAEVLRQLGNPRRAEIRRDLRKPVESWFYGPQDTYAVVFIDGRVFVKATASR